MLLCCTCKMPEGVKRTVDKIEAKSTQVAWGTAVGTGLGLLLGVAFPPAAIVSLTATMAVMISEPDSINVTVEDGGTLNLGQAYQKVASQLEDVKRLRDEDKKTWGDRLTKQASDAARRFLHLVIASAIGFLLYRSEWLRKAVIRKAGESHSKFWSLVHALIPGSWTRKKAEGKKAAGPTP